MKYVGSKQRLSKDIVPILQSIIDEVEPSVYIEPFVGGANIIDKIKHSNKFGLDSNYYLIEMWKALQKGWQIPERPTKKEYEDVKNNKSKYPPEWVAIVGFVSTYNAKWFGGYAKITQTKSGKIRDYYDEGKRNIEKQIPNIKDVKFETKDYRNIDRTIKNSLIYCDPPYNTNTTHKGLYGDSFNHDEYYQWVREMSKNNIVVCSEYYMPSDFVCIYEKGVNLHFDNRQLDKRVERLFVHESVISNCPRCNGKLLPSPIKNYNSFCVECDQDYGYSWIKLKEEVEYDNRFRFK